MKKILKIFILILLLTGSAFAETKEKKEQNMFY